MCDIVVLYVLKARHVYKDKKYKTIVGADAYKVKYIIYFYEYPAVKTVKIIGLYQHFLSLLLMKGSNVLKLLCYGQYNNGPVTSIFLSTFDLTRVKGSI